MTSQPLSAAALSSAGALLPTGVASAVFWIGAVACVVAQYFIIRAVWRVVPSETGSPDVPSPHRAMEIAWAILPGLLIIAVFVGAWRVLHPAVPSPELPTAVTGAPVAPPSRV